MSAASIRKRSILHPKDLMRRSVEDSQEGFRNSLSRQSKILVPSGSEVDRKSIISCSGFKNKDDSARPSFYQHREFNVSLRRRFDIYKIGACSK